MKALDHISAADDIKTGGYMQDVAHVHRMLLEKKGSANEVAMKSLSIKLPPGLRARLGRAAKKCGQTKSEIVRAALEQFLIGERPMSALELAGDLVGRGIGTGDLSTNPKYMEGYGK